uniref:hypothetical protein n=1 Tax=Salmonella sp. s51228 TaxID=3159652 RepID=UPI0039818ED6
AQVTTPSLELKLQNLMELVNNSQNEKYFRSTHESLLYSVVSWIRDHHFDTRIKMEKLFPGPTCDAEPLTVKAVMTNPLVEAGLTPNEDQLIIAMDNPVFEIMMA